MAGVTAIILPVTFICQDQAVNFRREGVLPLRRLGRVTCRTDSNMIGCQIEPFFFSVPVVTTIIFSNFSETKRQILMVD